MRRSHKFDMPFEPEPITAHLLPSTTLQQEEASALSAIRYPLSPIQAQSLRRMYLGHIMALNKEIQRLKARLGDDAAGD
jgi:hypothetical protein